MKFSKLSICGCTPVAVRPVAAAFDAKDFATPSLSAALPLENYR